MIPKDRHNYLERLKRSEIEAELQERFNELDKRSNELGERLEKHRRLHERLSNSPNVERSAERSMGPPDAREFEKHHGCVIPRKFSGEGAWSDQDDRSLKMKMRKYDKAAEVMYVENLETSRCRLVTGVVPK